MSVTCQSCGRENPDGFQFCGFCSAPLAPHASGEERKVVSVLFVDLVGFTARSDMADPEDVRAALRPYHALLKREIERFGGTVEKFIGDAVMAVFGAPLAHEDDAERAVRSALRITEAIQELNEEQGLDLSVRAAVNTGEAVVSLAARPERGEGIVTGDVVNTASRLQGIAPVGGVAVGEVTYRATQHVFDYEPLDDAHVKGKAEALRVWVAVGTKSRLGTDVEQARTPFVGRQDELDLVQRVYARALREPSVQLVTVAGEPGVGKSRLIAELRTWVDDQAELVWWRQGRCLPYGEGITFWALGEAVKAHAGILESDTAEEAAQKLAVAVEVVDSADRDWVGAQLRTLVGAGDPGGGNRQEAFAGWRTYLEAVAEARPLVLVIEDLHWADEPMLEFLEHLVDWAGEVPLVLACTARPEFFERRSGWGGGKRNASTISLKPLTSDETARLLSALLEETVLPAETQQALLERAGGNPLYAEEFVRMLLDRGILERQGRAVRLTAGAEVTVPETVQALIAARLDTLTADRKALLQDAAVMGKVFWSGALAEMGGRSDEEVRLFLHELARKELVRPARRSSVEGEAEFAFWHSLVRDVAYAQIPRVAKATKHRAAARWIESMAGDRVANHAELLSYHYTEALDLARAAGDDETGRELGPIAARMLVMAAERLIQLDAVRAGTYAERALELLPPEDPGRPDCLRLASKADFEAGHADRARERNELALELSRAAGDPVVLARVLTQAANQAWYRGETVRSDAFDREAIRILEPGGPSEDLATVLSTLVGHLALAGKAEEALALVERALALATEFDIPAEIVRDLQMRGVARNSLGDGRGLEDLQAGLELALGRGLSSWSVIGHTNVGYWVWKIETPESGLAVYRSGIEIGERRGEVSNSLWAKAETTWPLFDLGEWDVLVTTAEEILEWERQHGATQKTVIVSPMKALVSLYRDDTDAASALAQDFVPAARDIGDIQILMPALTVATAIARERGDLAAAVGFVDEMEQAETSRSIWGYHHLLELLRTLTRAGLIERAHAMADRARRKDACWGEGWLLEADAIVSEARGDAESAASKYSEAADAWREHGYVFEDALSQLGAGRSLITLGRWDDAEQHLHEAIGVLSRLRAQLPLAEANGLLKEVARLTS
jgi:class 3 adenylate cyclase/tetratricopeptide (TPR) repeat protein